MAKLSDMQQALLRFHDIDPKGMDSLDFEIELDRLKKEGDRRMIDLWQDYRHEIQDQIEREGASAVPMGIGHELLRAKINAPKAPRQRSSSPTKKVISKKQAESAEGVDLISFLLFAINNSEPTKEWLDKLYDEISKYESTWPEFGGIVFLQGEINGIRRNNIDSLKSGNIPQPAKLHIENAVLRVLPKSTREQAKGQSDARLESTPITSDQVERLQYFGVMDDTDGMSYAEAERLIHDAGVEYSKKHYAQRSEASEKRIVEVKRLVAERDAAKGGCASVIAVALFLSFFLAGTGIVIAAVS